MVNPVIIRSNPICLVGGGVAESADLDLVCPLAEALVAADSGAELAMRSGRIPAAVIGDFDSLSSEIRGEIPPERLHHIAEQDSTDFEKAMERIEAPLILAVGFTGGRVDHELAVLHGLLRFSHKPCVLLGAQEIIFHCPPELDMELTARTTVSLFPLRPVTGRSHGLEWPIDGLEFAPGRKIGTSNRAIGGKFRLWMDAPGMIGVLPRSQLAAFTQAVLRMPPERARWPVL